MLDIGNINKMKTSLTLFSTLVTLTLVELTLAKRGGAGHLAQATECPSTEGMMGICSEECTMTDENPCTDGKICCSNGCGHSCVTPQRPAAKGGCRYTKENWSECDEVSNTVTRTMTLKRGDEAACQATKTQTKPCSKRGVNKAGQCKYNKADWSDCDDTSDTRTRTLTLKPGSDEASCEATKLETKPCKTECTYKKSSASECEDGKLILTKTLLSGDPASCQPTKTVSKTCREGGKKKESRRNKRHRRKDKMFNCQYSLADRGDCDEVNKTRTFILTLKRGSRSICEESKSFSRPCSINEDNTDGCTYGKPVVTECVDGKRTMTRQLVSAEAGACDATKIKTKNCGGRKAKKDKKDKKGKDKVKGRKNKKNKNKKD